MFFTVPRHEHAREVPSVESSQNWVFLVGCVGLCLLLARPAGAEFYIAGQVGATFPQDVNNLQGIGPSEGISVSDLELQTSVLYGGKLGYFFPRANWLGIETEGYTTTPNLKQQVVTVTGPGGSISTVLSGKDVRVTTVAFNLVIRYPSKRIQPYAGVGVGVFFLGIPGFESATSPGLNVLAGTRSILSLGPPSWQRLWGCVIPDN